MSSKIQQLLKELRISNGDHLMLHGNLAILHQLERNKKIDQNLRYFLNQLKKKIGKKGVILIPTFTYSFCLNKTFNVCESKSEVGLFSELSRKLIKKRTSHPIFSFVMIGKEREYTKSSLNTCFGKNSLFDNFKRNNGKILCFGCGFSSITFIHHIEEFSKVNYRKYKIFSGHIKKKDNLKKINTKYFVRKNKKIKNNFLRFESNLKRKKIINYYNFDRFNIIKANSRKLFKHGIKAIKKNHHFLI